MTTYYIYIRTNLETYNILNLPESKLRILQDAYALGQDSFVISGKNYRLKSPQVITVYAIDEERYPYQKLKRYWQENNLIKKVRTDTYILPKYFAKFGDDVTAQIIGDNIYGYRKNEEIKTIPHKIFIDQERISELKLLKDTTQEFDLAKLIRMCEEINSNYENNNFLSVAMLSRAIIDHIPPIFSKPDFSQLANTYPGKSLKKSLMNLESTMRNIADNHLHSQIRNKETLPTETQINFKNDFDVLLSEIIRHLR